MQVKTLLVGAAIAAAFAIPLQAYAEQAGGTMRVYHRGTPPSGSIHEEATSSTVMPYLGLDKTYHILVLLQLMHLSKVVLLLLGSLFLS